MPEICIKNRWPYIAVRPECGRNRNWGAIEKSYYQHARPAGRFHIQQPLQHLIAGALPNNFHPSVNGAGPGQAGVGFIGWIDFGSVGRAIGYLAQYYHIIWCPIGGVIETDGGLKIPFPEIDKDGFWDSLRDYLKGLTQRGHKISKVVFRGGGTIRIPDCFRDWCAGNNIEIEIIDDPGFDNIYPPQTWSDEDGSPYVANAD